MIGMYASTSRQRLTILNDKGQPRTEGKFIQVSRLANPLVNELIIDTPSKDRWNATDPEDEARFQEFYKNPSLAQAFQLIKISPCPERLRSRSLDGVLYNGAGHGTCDPQQATPGGGVMPWARAAYHGKMQAADPGRGTHSAR
jgi:hypothetical protein